MLQSLIKALPVYLIGHCSLIISSNRQQTVRFLVEMDASVNPTYPGGNT